MKLEVGVETTAILIKALYEQEKQIHPHLIPMMVYYNIAQELQKYEGELGCFDRWVTEKLEIAPTEAFNPIRLNDCKENGFYCETEAGQVNIIGIGDL